VSADDDRVPSFACWRSPSRGAALELGAAVPPRSPRTRIGVGGFHGKPSLAVACWIVVP